MARPSVKRAIDDRIYEFFPLNPTMALRILTRLTKIVGKPLGVIGGALGSDLANGAMAISSLIDKSINLPAVLGPVIDAFVERLNENEVIDTIQMLVTATHVKTPSDQGTRPVIYEQDFEGKTKHLLKVFAVALQENYADFFEESGELGAALKKVRDQVSKSVSATSTG